MRTIYFLCTGNGAFLRYARGRVSVPRDRVAGLVPRVGRAERRAAVAGVADARGPGAARARALAAALGAAHPARRAADRARRTTRRALSQK